MQFDEIRQKIEQKLPGVVLGAEPDAIDPWVEIAADRWYDVARLLRRHKTLGFNFLNCITGVDYFEPDAKKAAKVDWQPHIEVVYHLSSLTQRHRLVAKIKLPRWRNGTPGELPVVPSIADLWQTAAWHEREVYDLMGVEFTDHPDFRRILCPEDWVGHPLRKDYEMPLEYHGIRGR